MRLATEIKFDKPVKKVHWLKLTDENKALTFEDAMRRSEKDHVISNDEVTSHNMTLPLILFIVYNDDSIEKKIIE
jgi:hypothetical protein